MINLQPAKNAEIKNQQMLEKLKNVKRKELLLIKRLKENDFAKSMNVKKSMNWHERKEFDFVLLNVDALKFYKKIRKNVIPALIVN